MAAALPVLQPASDEVLKAKLEQVVTRFDASFLGTDPLKFVHRFSAPEDQEVVGLLAAAFAYGNVKAIFRSVERILDPMGPSPRRFLERFAPKRDGKRFRGFKHRFHDERDLVRLLDLIGQAIRRHGSLGALFAAGLRPGDPHVGPALARFTAALLGKTPRASRVRFLLSSPEDGSACKRMLLYLRWMARPADGIDLGIWKDVPPSKLLVPLDTHTFRISRYLGLTRRNTNGWKAAEEVTGALARLDPADPVRYDFGLCRLGILDLCPARRDVRKCRPCDLYEVCRL